MELDAIWQTFAETGAPARYMLDRAAQRGSTEKETDSVEEPRATD